VLGALLQELTNGAVDLEACWIGDRYVERMACAVIVRDLVDRDREEV
jgi:hypothetical protein